MKVLPTAVNYTKVMHVMTTKLDPIVAERTHLTYLAPGDVLKGRVEPTIWMRMCDAFAAKGLNVELVTVYAYRKENVQRDKVFEHYGIKDQKFRLTILPTPFGVEPRLLWYRSWTALTNLLHAYSQMLFRKTSGRFDNLIFYSRSPVAIVPYLYLRRMFNRRATVSYFFETHALPTGKGAIRVAQKADGVIVSSRKLASDMAEKLKIRKDRIHVAYLAGNASPVAVDRSQAIHQLGLDPAQRYIVYTGKLLMPEVNLMLSAAEVLATSVPSARMFFVGGNPAILADCNAEIEKRKLKNVIFTGFVAPSLVGLYQKAADILMLYLVSDRNIIEYITPSKIFDYLQAGRPIVASDYPILHEIVQHEHNALLVKPHEPVQLATELKRVLEDPQLAARLSKAAEADSRQYSWPQRTQSIWEFMQRVLRDKSAAGQN